MTTSNDTITNILTKPLSDSRTIPILYRVKTGDTLGKIIFNFYGIRFSDSKYPFAEASILFFNPTIKNPNTIFARQILRIMPLEPNFDSIGMDIPTDFIFNYRAEPTTTHILEPRSPHYIQRFENSIPTTHEAEEYFSTLAWIEEHYSILSMSPGAGFNNLGIFSHENKRSLIAGINDAYARYKANIITKNQYSYQRSKILKNFAQQVGPIDKILFGGKTAAQANRISRLKGVPATIKIDKNIVRMSRLSKLATKGNIVLTAGSLFSSCHQIGNTNSRQEKNEVFIETTSSTFVSVSIGIGLSIFMVSNPIGWAWGLTIGIGSAVVSYGAGKGAVALYDLQANKQDFVKDLRIDRVCN